MLGQQLQDGDVLPRAGVRAMPLFHTLPQMREVGRQLPVSIDVGIDAVLGVGLARRLPALYAGTLMPRVCNK